MGHVIKCHGDREDKHVVLPRCDLDAECIRDAEPLLRDLDLLAGALEPIVVLDDVPLQSRSEPIATSPSKAVAER